MKRIAMGVAATALAVGGSVAMTAPAQASPVITGGLVNVVIDDSLNELVEVEDVNVGVALQVAANVCGTAVNVLAEQVPTGTITCEADGVADVSQFTDAARGQR